MAAPKCKHKYDSNPAKYRLYELPVILAGFQMRRCTECQARFLRPVLWEQIPKLFRRRKTLKSQAKTLQGLSSRLKLNWKKFKTIRRSSSVREGVKNAKKTAEISQTVLKSKWTYIVNAVLIIAALLRIYVFTGSEEVAVDFAMHGPMIDDTPPAFSTSMDGSTSSFRADTENEEFVRIILAQERARTTPEPESLRWDSTRQAFVGSKPAAAGPAQAVSTASLIAANTSLQSPSVLQASRKNVISTRPPSNAPAKPAASQSATATDSGSRQQGVAPIAVNIDDEPAQVSVRMASLDLARLSVATEEIHHRRLKVRRSNRNQNE